MQGLSAARITRTVEKPARLRRRLAEMCEAPSLAAAAIAAHHRTAD